MVYLYRQNNETVVSKDTTHPKMVLSGRTMGTTYRIVYLDPGGRDFKKEIDSILVDFNQSLSTYIPDSELSRLNRHDSLVFESDYFYPVLQTSKEVFSITNGAFDPTIGPLVNAWGFGPDGPSLQDSLGVKKLLEQVGFENLEFNEKGVIKSYTDVYLDFSV